MEANLAKSSKISFTSNYLLINSKQASLLDTGRLLFSSNLDNRNFIESSFEREESFIYRLLIVISVLLQKFLLKMSMPMRYLGRAIVYSLNFLHINGGFFGLLTNILQVKVLLPDPKSATFLSMIGFIDMRMDLDSNIKYGNPMYYPALSMMACKASYNNAAYNKALIEGSWKMEFLGFKHYWNDFLQTPATQVVLFRDKSVEHDTIFVCFRGTQLFNLDDWCSDIDLSWFEFPEIGKIHSGFLKALGMQSSVGWAEQQVEHGQRPVPLAYYDIRDTLRTLLENNPKTKFIVTGHSLGGALAALFPAILFYHGEDFLIERLKAVYTFGQPRVGDEQFGNYMKNKLRKNGIDFYRYVYSNDMVPRVPFDGMFKHFGTCIYYDSKYQATIVDEEPYKNYLSIWGVIAMRINVIYELTRSFVMGTNYGPDYKEGWVLFFVRIFGLLVPGVPAHCAQDYVNSTRLAFPHHHPFLHQNDQVSLLTRTKDGILHLMSIWKIPMKITKLVLASMLKLFK